MRSSFFIFALLSVVALFANDSLAQQPGCPGIESVLKEHLEADDYARLQQNAPEQLQIRVLKVIVRRVQQQNTILPVIKRGLPSVLKSDEVEIEAKVTEAKRSKSGLKNENFIKIYYTTNQNYSLADLEIWEAISPPMLEVNSLYEVYLKRIQLHTFSEDDGYRYVPVAYSKSFQEIETPNK